MTFMEVHKIWQSGAAKQRAARKMLLEKVDVFKFARS